MARISEQVEWLSLVDVSGPSLASSILEEVFPQGLEKVETPRRQRLRAAYDEWRDAVDECDPDIDDLHTAWTRMVIQEALEYEDGVLVPRERLGHEVVYRTPEHGVEVAPDFAVRGNDGKPRLLIAIHPPGTDLEKPLRGDRWPASPAERMTLLCRVNGTRVGLVTNGEQWMLVNAPIGSTSGYASWFARLWWHEPVTLKAFVSLLGVRRCFGPPEETLDRLLERSISFQEEVTDTLGEQVRRAVEVLIQALGRADQDRNGELLKDVRPAELYEAGLTVMMRLVFILCAEERGLLLLGDPIYDQHYAISTLRASLREDESRYGPEVLERRHDAWSRMLSVFRAIYGGIEHEALRMPALGGSLFDPDRFPFLEGRGRGTSWREEPAVPLPIDNRTALLLLTALQVLEQRSGAQLLSYRALDVEQIGHIYEGLLEYTVARLPEATVGLIGSQKVRHPTIGLGELESLRTKGIGMAVEHLAGLTGRSATAIRGALERGDEGAASPKLIQACGGDETLARRLRPFAALIRMDGWGDLLVYRAGSFAIARGADRRETGTHYTPRSLTESIVEKTLEPIAYEGPTEGKPHDEWKLRSPAELLDLKICDPAMGSGAFLVQVCRYLAERLVEAWAREEDAGRAITVEGVVRDNADAHEPLPKNLDDRLLIARRLIAEKCLYGVDLNPLAVELSKLSIWLATLAKGRPFGFLDHNLRCGDSLLGIHRLDQLTKLHMDPDSASCQPRLFGRNIENAVADSLAIRNQLRAIPIRDIRDVETMARLDREAKKRIEAIQLVADAMIGEALRSSGDARLLDSALHSLSVQVEEFLNGDEKVGGVIAGEVKQNLSIDLPEGKSSRRSFHWPLEFPEIFARENVGFDAMVGNPPFLGGKRISTVLGAIYNEHLVAIHAGASKNVDLVAHFFRRAFSLLRNGGNFGLLATNTIAEGDTRQGGLEWMLKHGATVYAAYPNQPWPGSAAVVTSRVHVHKGEWCGPRSLLGRPVQYISPFLSDHEEWSPQRLKTNEGIAFQGSIVLGMGFVLTPDEAQRMLDADPRNRDVLFPYLNGENLNSDPEQRPSRWVINFWDWPEERANTYRLPYEWIRKRVYQERLEKSKEKSYRNIMSMWWLHWNARPGLYHAIGRGHHFERHPEGWDPGMKPIERVMAITRVSKTLAFSFVDGRFVFSDATVAFSLSRDRDFAMMQSGVHAAFAWQYASRLKSDLRYSPTDALEPFPFPADSDESGRTLDELGSRFHIARSVLMRADRIGLTKLYNRFHAPEDRDARIEELRELHREIDLAVARTYGWGGLDLGHGFYEVPYLPANDRVRFAISEPARLEVVRRLSVLNHERYEEEVALGLHGRAATRDPAVSGLRRRIAV